MEVFNGPFDQGAGILCHHFLMAQVGEENPDIRRYRPQDRKYQKHGGEIPFLFRKGSEAPIESGRKLAAVFDIHRKPDRHEDEAEGWKRPAFEAGIKQVKDFYKTVRGHKERLSLTG
ncbi:MAG: hypothetical protein K2X47_19685 [Bdellovibrionales bacterium]|nr:hypothetical protein [Bdellovibrionales bacterium]